MKSVNLKCFSQQIAKKKRNKESKTLLAAGGTQHGGYAVVATDRQAVFFYFLFYFLSSMFLKLLMWPARPQRSDFGALHHCGDTVVSIASSCVHVTASNTRGLQRFPAKGRTPKWDGKMKRVSPLYIYKHIYVQYICIYSIYTHML